MASLPPLVSLTPNSFHEHIIVIITPHSLRVGVSLGPRTASQPPHPSLQSSSPLDSDMTLPMLSIRYSLTHPPCLPSLPYLHTYIHK